MRNYLKILVGLVAVLIRVETAQAQLDNRAFTSPTPGRSRETTEVLPVTDSMEGVDAYMAPAAGELRLSLHAFTFFKDNEYFNKIVDGYTLYGTQLNPQLVYYPTKDLRIEAGVFLWKDFGNPVLSTPNAPITLPIGWPYDAIAQIVAVRTAVPAVATP